MKHKYLVQPYRVGSKTSKSIALVIPHQIVQYYSIDPSTVIILRTDDARKKMTLEAIQDTDTNEKFEETLTIAAQNSVRSNNEGQ
jgi:hypothetical protein